MERDQLWHLAEANRERIITYCQELVRIPSLTGEEGRVAEYVLQSMEAFGYDEALADSAGNIIGHIRGGPGRSTLLHAHLDVVDAGNARRWTEAPYSGALRDGYIWGRGAADDKGCVAAEVLAGALLKEAGFVPAGDVYVSAVVGEEVGGLGSRHLAASFHPDLAIIGEPSSNTLRRGHRGRCEFVVTVRGRSAHASVPSQAINPHYDLARVVLAIRDLEMFTEPVTGGSTVAPTVVRCDVHNANVIPGELALHLDWRNAPGESPEAAMAKLQALLDDVLGDSVSYTLEIRTDHMTSYTGYESDIRQAVAPFWMEADDPLLIAAQAYLRQALGREITTDVWQFYTDGGFLYGAGVPCLGFGPGHPEMAHVFDERLAVDELIEAVVGYMALALQMGAVR
ncbi:MAG: M20/M25/M40 family metallo-hydrolase [Anaerolineales bacterium]